MELQWDVSDGRGVWWTCLICGASLKVTDSELGGHGDFQKPDTQGEAA
jgi:hypothetical protein